MIFFYTTQILKQLFNSDLGYYTHIYIYIYIWLLCSLDDNENYNYNQKVSIESLNVDKERNSDLC